MTCDDCMGENTSTPAVTTCAWCGGGVCALHLERAVTLRMGRCGTTIGCEHRKGFLPRMLGSVGAAILGPRPIGTY
jgi:hypothetical protein